jgi:hypothetical protein
MTRVTVTVETSEQTSSFTRQHDELGVADLLAQCLTKVAEAFDDRHLATAAGAATETTVPT